MTKHEIIVHDSNSVVHDSEGCLVQPGASCAMVIRPQACPLLPVALHVTEGAEAFELTNVTVGNRSQFSNFTIAMLLIDFGKRFQPIDPIRHGICFETIQTAMDFWITVRNISSEPRRFRAEWQCLRPEKSSLLDAFYQRAEQHCRDVEVMSARIAQLEAELANARSEANRIVGRVARVNDDGTVDIEMRPGESFTMGPTQPHAQANAFKPERINMTWSDPVHIVSRENGTSAVAAAPARSQPIDRWQRGAPCTWDPWGE